MSRPASTDAEREARAGRRARLLFRALLVLGVWFCTVLVVRARGGLVDRPGLVLGILSALSVAVIALAIVGPIWVGEPAMPVADERGVAPGGGAPDHALDAIDRFWPWGVLAAALLVGAAYGLVAVRWLDPRASALRAAVLAVSAIVDVWSWRRVQQRPAMRGWPLWRWLPAAWLIWGISGATQPAAQALPVVERIVDAVVWAPVLTAWIWIWGAFLTRRLVLTLTRRR